MLLIVPTVAAGSTIPTVKGCSCPGCTSSNCIFPTCTVRKCIRQNHFFCFDLLRWFDQWWAIHFNFSDWKITYFSKLKGWIYFLTVAWTGSVLELVWSGQLVVLPLCVKRPILSGGFLFFHCGIVLFVRLVGRMFFCKEWDGFFANHTLTFNR